MSEDERDEEILDDIGEDAADLEHAAERRDKTEQGDSFVDRISDAAKNVLPGDSDKNGH